jgi:hypothetical protein
MALRTDLDAPGYCSGGLTVFNDSALGAKHWRPLEDCVSWMRIAHGSRDRHSRHCVGTSLALHIDHADESLDVRVLYFCASLRVLNFIFRLVFIYVFTASCK